MAQQSQSRGYKQGYSNYTLATHQTRTAESDAAFLLPHIKKTDHILDVGCGPGTITTGFAKYASEGKIVGIDISAAVLEKAKALAAEANIPNEGPGSVVFEQGNILESLPYADETFDIIYSSQLFGHIPPPDLPLKALTEMRRVLKPGGILSARSALDAHFYPRNLDLDRLWGANQRKVLRQDAPDDEDSSGASLPALYRKAGFNEEKIRIGAGTTVYAGPETRKWLAWRASGQLKQGDPYYQSWLDAGISEDEIQETLRAVQKWVETEDAWFASMQCEMLAWK